MKKNFMYAMMSTIVLTGAVNLTACSSGDEIVDNPDYNPETNTVKTEFTISLPRNVVNTRQSGTTVQQAENIDAFRGMTSINLVPFNAAVAETSNKYGSIIPLENIDAKQLMTTNNSKVYSNTTIPVGTTHFLFYGKAPVSGTDFVNGKLAVAGLNETDFATANSVTFTPVSIATNVAYAGSDIGQELVTLLNTVAGAKTESNATWASATNTILSEAYENLKRLKTGSTRSVEAALENLYNMLDNMPSGTSADDIAIATAVKTAITTGVSGHANTFSESTLTLNNFYKTNGGYPADKNLPDGAARISWSEDKFVAASAMEYGGVLNVANLTDYVYPADLQYFGNSEMKASKNIQSTNYTGKSWNDCLNLYGDGSVVTSETKSVAITSPIEYGVGRLDLQVKLEDTPSETVKFYDSRGEEVAIPTGGFKLTGVLIGSQQQAKWNFTPNTSAAKYTIYDKEMNQDIYASSSTASGTNYTLVLQTEDDKDVYVALEFQNGSSSTDASAKPFKGSDGMIPVGGKFYLVGKLEVDKNNTTVYGTGVNQTKSVFKQDFKTTATFTIKQGTASEGSTEGFAKATNGLPDLQTPQVELGLSVNLEWKSGFTYTVEI